MFEHFGLKDAFRAVWRYRIRICLATLIVVVAGTLLMSLVPIKQEPAVLGVDIIQDESEETVLKEAGRSFYLEYLGQDSSLTSKTLAAMYIDTLGSMACNQYVSDYILKVMSKEEIIKRLQVTYAPEEIKTDYFNQFLQRTTDSATGQNITLAVRSYDEEYASLVVGAYMSWIQQLTQQENSQVRVVMLDESTETINVPPVQNQTITQSKGLTWKKVAVMLLIISIAVGSILAMGVQFFNPVINRKHDFEELGINVLGDIRAK